MIRIQISLPEEEARALAALAERELRDPREQVRHILREELERRDLLKARECAHAEAAHV